MGYKKCSTIGFSNTVNLILRRSRDGFGENGLNFFNSKIF